MLQILDSFGHVFYFLLYSFYSSLINTGQNGKKKTHQCGIQHNRDPLFLLWGPQSSSSAQLSMNTDGPEEVALAHVLRLCSLVS